MNLEPENKTSSFPCPHCEIERNKIRQAYKKSDGIFMCSQLGGCGKSFESREEANSIRNKLIKEKPTAK